MIFAKPIDSSKRIFLNHYFTTYKEHVHTYSFFTDISPLLLCRKSNFPEKPLTDKLPMDKIITSVPTIINNKNLQVYKGKYFFNFNKFFFYIYI